MKENIITWMKYGIFALVVIISLYILGDYFTCNDIGTTSVMQGFRQEKKDSLDVITIGASEVFAGVSPVIAWQEYGYTSYDMAIGSLPGTVYKAMVREALRTQNPDVFVIEVNGFLQYKNYYTKDKVLKKTFDNMPMSLSKIQSINEIIPLGKRMEYYLPLLYYHNNWMNSKDLERTLNLRRNMKKNGISNFKGMSTFSYAYPMDDYKISGKEPFVDVASDALDDLLAYLKQNDVKQVLFLRMPHAWYLKNNVSLEEVKARVEAAGYKFLDCSTMMEDLGLDLKQDYYNREHLNIYGMEKFTRYLCQYLRDNYEIKTDHSEELTKSWDECTKKANVLIDQCKENIAKGKEHVIHYMEESFYITPTPYKHPNKVLDIKIENFK